MRTGSCSERKSVPARLFVPYHAQVAGKSVVSDVPCVAHERVAPCSHGDFEALECPIAALAVKGPAGNCHGEDPLVTRRLGPQPLTVCCSQGSVWDDDDDCGLDSIRRDSLLPSCVGHGGCRRLDTPSGGQGGLEHVRELASHDCPHPRGARPGDVTWSRPVGGSGRWGLWGRGCRLSATRARITLSLA